MAVPSRTPARLGLLAPAILAAAAGAALPPPVTVDFGIIGVDGEEVTIDTVGSDFDTVLILWDAFGHAVTLNDDIVPDVLFQTPNLQSRITQTLFEGTYYFSVYGSYAFLLYNDGFQVTTGPFNDGGLAKGQVHGIPWQMTVTPGATNFPNGPAVPGGVKWGRFEIDAPELIELGEIAQTGTLVNIDTFGSTFDTEIGLWDAGGELLAQNDDVPGMSGNSKIANLALEAGEYFFSVSGYNTVFADGFSAVVSEFAEQGAAYGKANDAYLSTIIGPGEAQMFRFIVDDPDVIQLGVVAAEDEPFDLHSLASDFDTEIAVWKSDGTLITTNDDSGLGGYQSLLADLTLPAGNYFFAVSGYPTLFLSGPNITPSNGSAGGKADGMINSTPWTTFLKKGAAPNVYIPGFPGESQLFAFTVGEAAPPCPADFNGDTTPGDIFDLFDFLAALDNGLDYNADTSPADIFDLFDFLAVLDQPCP